MFQPDHMQVGNWISKKHPASLIEAYRVLEVCHNGVTIERGTTINEIKKVGNRWKLVEVLEKQVLKFWDMKGIPLSIQILEGCGFKLDSKSPVTNAHDTDGLRRRYSDKNSFTLNYDPQTPNKFTHESCNTNIEFVHQLQNVYSNVMNKELDITINRYNFQLMK